MRVLPLRREAAGPGAAGRADRRGPDRRGGGDGRARRLQWVAAPEAGLLDPARARGTPPTSPPCIGRDCASRCRCRRPPPRSTRAPARVAAAPTTPWPRRCAAGARAGLGTRRGGVRPCLWFRGQPEVLTASGTGSEPTWFGDPRCGCGAPARPRRCCDDGCSAPSDRVRRLRRAAHRHHCAEASRRHRQDVHDRRTRRLVRRRGHARLPELLLVTFGREATQELRERSASGQSAERPARSRRGPHGHRSGRGAAGGSPRRRGRGAPSPTHRRARGVRRRDDRDHAPVLRADADGTSASPGRRRRGVRRVGGRPGRRGRRRLLRPQVRRQRVRTPAFDRTEALRLARRRSATCRPASRPAGASGTAAVRLSATAVRGEVERRKRARGLYTHDDLVTRLHDALGDPVREAAQRLRSRYRVVLVDEFQDTDPLQRGILRHFVGHVALVLIGRPSRRSTPSRRGRRQLPRRRRAGRHPRHARPQLAQRCRADARPRHRARRRGARRPADRRPGGGVGSSGAAACGCARRYTTARASAAPRRAGVQRTRPRPHSEGQGALVARDVAADVTAALPGATTRATCWADPATSPSSSARTTRAQ